MAETQLNEQHGRIEVVDRCTGPQRYAVPSKRICDNRVRRSPLGESDVADRLQLLDRDVAAAAQGIVGGDHEDHRDLDRRPLLQPRDGWSNGDEGEIGSVALQELEAVLARVGGLEGDRCAGEALAERDHGVPKNVANGRAARGDSQLAGLSLTPTMHVSDAAFDAVQPRAQTFVEELAGCGRSHTPRSPLEQRDAELLLETSDVVADCRLRAAEDARDCAEISTLEYRHKRPRVLEGHALSLSDRADKFSSTLGLSVAFGVAENCGGAGGLAVARMDFDRVAAAYDASRALSREALEDWRAALAGLLPPPDGRPILDVGSGTGQFAEAFAGWFGCPVIGVEPSAGMRREAERKRPRRQTRFLSGTAEQIPLPDQSCGAAWLSTVIHHVPDLRACARELRRVLTMDSRVLIRNAFAGRPRDIELFRFFPEAGAVVDSFPSVASTIEAFAREGFAFERLSHVAQRTAPNLEAIRAVVELRVDTTLSALSEVAFARGLEALDAEIGAHPGRGPVVDHLDLLVLKRSQSQHAGS